MKKFKTLSFVLLAAFTLMLSNKTGGYTSFAKNKVNSESSSKVSSKENLRIKNDENENSKELDFIKSQKPEDGESFNNNLLLYGGIFLISVSAIGVIFTIIPKSKKSKKHSAKAREYHNDNSKRRKS